MKYLPFLIMLLLIAACGQNSNPLDVEYYKGKEGVTLTFDEGAPPDSFFSNTPIPVRITLANKGAFSLPSQGVITVGFDPFYLEQVQGQEIDYSFQLQGKNRNFSLGETTYKDLGYIAGKDVPGNLQFAKTKLRVSTCYPYGTKLTSQLCIDTAVLGQNLRNQVCTSETLSFNQGQGAPVAITKVEPRFIPLGDSLSVELIITITNLGSGRVLSPAQTDQLDRLCTVESDEERYNLVRANVRLADSQLVCEPSMVPLQGKDATVRCHLPDDKLINTRSNYLAQFTADLEYTYQQEYMKEISIEQGKTTDKDFPERKCSPGYKWVGESTCVLLCEYCQTHPNDEECTRTQGYNAYSANFSCTCSRQDCTRLLDKAEGNSNGLCIPHADLCASGFCCDRSGLS